MAETEHEAPKSERAEGVGDFEGNLRKLEEAVAKLEEGNITLDESLGLYEQGIEAYRLCQQALAQAELKVRKLVETLEGELKEEPFEPPQEQG